MYKLIPTSAVLLALLASPSKAQTTPPPAPPVNSHGLVLGTPQNALDDFAAIYKILKVYRDSHNGQYPESNGAIITDMVGTPGKYGFKNFPEGRLSFTNPDFILHDLRITPQLAESVSPYHATYKRLDGSLIGGEKPAGARDLLDWTDLYYYRNAVTFPDGGTSLNPVGFYVVLWDDGTVEKVPFDLAQFTPGENNDFTPTFPTQVNTNFDTLSYEERYGEDATPGKPTPGPDQEAAPDNGGPEALLQLSRRLALPGTYGIERDDLWKAFDPTYADFKLSDVQSLTAPLGLKTEVKKLTLAQLQATGTAAVIPLKNSNRLVTLTALDTDRAVIVDRGLTQNIGITQLEADYSGEAIVPTPALTQKSAVVATDPVRLVPLPTLDTEVSQQVKLRNTGTKPVTLQLEYPLLGVTESKLSQPTLAPGATATLDLKMKWRPSLKTPTQNVLVSLRTSDPIAPRLQLAFLLTPPQQ